MNAINVFENQNFTFSFVTQLLWNTLKYKKIKNQNIRKSMFHFTIFYCVENSSCLFVCLSVFNSYSISVSLVLLYQYASLKFHTNTLYNLFFRHRQNLYNFGIWTKWVKEIGTYFVVIITCDISNKSIFIFESNFKWRKYLYVYLYTIRRKKKERKKNEIYTWEKIV